MISLARRTYNSIRSSYIDDETRLEKYALLPGVSHRIYRPVSFVLTVPFAILGIQANAATVLRYPLWLVGLCLYCVGGYEERVAGALCHACAFLLDYIDGNLARYYGKTSNLGAILDEVADRMGTILPALALSIGLYRHPDLLLQGVLRPIAGPPILLIGILTCLASVLSYKWRWARILRRLRLIQSSEARGTPSSNPALHSSQKRTVPAWVASRPLILGYKICYNLAFLLETSILLLSIFDVTTVYVVFRFLFQTPRTILKIAFPR